MTLPYQSVKGSKVQKWGLIEKYLTDFGCSKVGRFTDITTGHVTIQFVWNDRACQISANPHGYAAAVRKEHPQMSQQRALDLGEKAVPSMLRDWIKRQLTAVETGLLSFDEVFMPHILLPDGRTLLEAASEHLLPALEHK